MGIDKSADMFDRDRDRELLGRFIEDEKQQVIDVLLRMGRERNIPDVLDEFPYLARVSPSLPSVIQNASAPGAGNGPRPGPGCCADRRCRSWEACCRATPRCGDVPRWT
jgi:hypothetical protein